MQLELYDLHFDLQEHFFVPMHNFWILIDDSTPTRTTRTRITTIKLLLGPLRVARGQKPRSFSNPILWDKRQIHSICWTILQSKRLFSFQMFSKEQFSIDVNPEGFASIYFSGLLLRILDAFLKSFFCVLQWKYNESSFPISEYNLKSC